jgi:glycosyltransferase involved in cell wall biosynthesis
VTTLKVSIIVPIYNGSLLIGRCLDSILNQNGDYQLEVIVVDDGSTDNSAELVRSYPKSITLLDQPNQGPAAARNRGIDAASGKYLAFLDADDYWLPDFLNETVQFLEKNTEAIAVSVAQVHKIPGKLDIVSPSVLESKPEEYSDPILLNDFFKFWAEHNHVCTGSVLMRTEIVKETGGQREDLRITEDLEFWAYLATFGKWGFIPEVLMISDGGAVTKQQGWLEKNKKRWESTPTVEEWEKRIIDRIDDEQIESYKIARGRIAGNLAYSMIMSKRRGCARDIIIKYNKYLHNNIVNRLLVTSSGNLIFWAIVCFFLKTREAVRNLVI